MIKMFFAVTFLLILLALTALGLSMLPWWAAISVVAITVLAIGKASQASGQGMSETNNDAENV